MKLLLRNGRLVLLLVAALFMKPAFGEANERIRVGVLRSSPPFSFIDREGTGIRGYCVDLARILAGNMRTKIEFHALNPSQLEQALATAQIDFICGLMVQPEKRTGFNLIETGIQVEKKFFVNHACLTVTCYKDLPGHRVALERGRDLTPLLPSLKDIQFIEADSEPHALALVDSGEADIYISDARVTSLYLIEKNGLKNIKEVGMPIESVPLTLALRQDNTELLTALSGAFGRVLENNTHKVLEEKWLGQHVGSSTWNEYLRFVVAGLGVVGAVLLLFVFWNLTLKRKVGEVTRDLQQSEQKYRDLIESSPDMIHLISSDGTVKLANKIALARLGYSDAEMLSLRIRDLVTQEQRQSMDDFVRALFLHGSGNRELVFQGKDGTTVHAEMVATTVRGLNGSFETACCFSRDLSDRKRLEDDLIQSDRLAIMGQMAAGIAHEINNPLGIILSNSEDLLRHEMDAEDRRESLQSIERNAVRAGKIIEDLLSFTGPKQPSRVPIDLQQLIEESLLFLKQKLKQKKIEVKRSFPLESVIFLGDESLIQQLLINLLLNSIQAIQHEGVITIRLAMNSSNGKKVRLEVEDTGIGIPQMDLPKIFDPFFTSRKEKGFGLGLFTSRIIVEKHGGCLKAESKANKGTVMTVELPLGPSRPPDSIQEQIP